MADIFDKVRDANPERKLSELDRRMVKLGEEYGEACQAYLSVSSATNGKDKTWTDVREELVDVIIVAMDILLTQFPDEPQGTHEEKMNLVNKMVDKKLVKWAKKKAAKQTV
jgi:hypothetical protein